MSFKAEVNLIHPCRLYVTGRAKSGKTTEVVRLIDQIFRPQVDRTVVCVPSWFSQRTFDPIRDMVNNDRDVLDYQTSDPFKEFFSKLVYQVRLAKEAGREPVNTLLVVDDMAGQACVSKRMSSLANLAIQASHLKCSIIMISQQPKAVIAAFRQNADAYICFPSQSNAGKEWLHEELNGNHMTKEGFNLLIEKAWRGKRQDFDEMNQHFLFVLLKNREKTRYFMDFSVELESTVGDAS